VTHLSIDPEYQAPDPELIYRYHFRRLKKTDRITG
jgi:hypothetical protein